MVFRQLLIVAFLSLSLLQPNGCSANEPVQADQNALAQPTPTPKPSNDPRKGDQNNMDLLEQKVLNKEPSSVNLAKQMGKSAVPVLTPLATNADSDVRSIALSCLAFTGGDDVADIFIDGLKDESPSVSVEASRGLQRYLSPAIYQKLLDVYDEIKDPARRKDVALMLGKIDDANINDLKKKDEEEKDAEAKEGLMVASAKLGDAKARDEFLRRLSGAKDQELKRFLDYVEYIQKTWAIKGLSPVLGDKSEIVRIGVDGLPDSGPEYLRGCDLAVNLIDKLLKPKFAFQVAGNRNYSDPELQQVRSFLGTLR